jgi:hypothetical protein
MESGHRPWLWVGWFVLILASGCARPAPVGEAGGIDHSIAPTQTRPASQELLALGRTT